MQGESKITQYTNDASKKLLDKQRKESGYEGENK